MLVLISRYQLETTYENGGGAEGSWLLTSCIRESVHILSPVSRHCHCLVWRNPNDQHYPTVREITDKDQYYTRMLTPNLQKYTGCWQDTPSSILAYPAYPC